MIRSAAGRRHSQISPRRAWGWLSTPRALSGRRAAHFRKGRATSGEWAQDGTVRLWTDLPDVLFINGCTIHPDGKTLLACESMTGRILAIDMREPHRWSAWLTDEILTPGVPGIPGANGIKIHDWHAWISVSGRRLILRTRIESDGTPGPLQTVGTRIMADDFAIAVSGALYIATHPAQSVVRLDTSGTRITVAGPNQGAVGSTACAFGRTPADDMAIL
jgi:sugar lactone lactonase YvrE